MPQGGFYLNSFIQILIMVSNSETFAKAERLCSKKTITELFEKGRSFFCHSLQVIWITGPDSIPFPAQVAFSVSKKSFRNAVIRNFIKRRLREAYRKNKYLLYQHLQEKEKRISLFIIYKDKPVPDYKSLEKAIKEAISKLIQILNE